MRDARLALPGREREQPVKPVLNGQIDLILLTERRSGQ